jgi:hypothetical protein
MIPLSDGVRARRCLFVNVAITQGTTCAAGRRPCPSMDEGKFRINQGDGQTGQAV